MSLRSLSAYNGFVAQATGQVISYIRSPKDFPINRYTQYVKAPSTVFTYTRVTRDEQARITADADFVFADGSDRPTGDWMNMRFEMVEVSVKRRAYSYRIGDMALQTAKDTWKPLQQHVGMASQKAMTNRTNRVMDLLETTSNWAGHVDTANSLNAGAGKWDTASDESSDPHYLAIKKSLLEAYRKINLDTNAVVKQSDLALVISPTLAQRIANTSEIHNFVKYGPFSKAQLEGKENYNQQWGLPPSLYGFDVVVEDTPLVTTKVNASETSTNEAGTRSYAKADDSAILISKKGGINGNYGAPSFSTVQMYFFEYEMAVYAWSDPKNFRTEGSVIDCFAEVLASPHSGYLITGVL